MRRPRGTILATVLAVGLTLLAMAPARVLVADEPEPMFVEPVAGGHDLEMLLVQSLFDLKAGRLNDAYWRISRLARKQPDFGLAQLVYGDVLMAMSNGLTGFGQAAPPDQLTGLRHEAQARLGHYLESPPNGALPANLLRIPEGVESLILVDTTRFRLYLIENRDGLPVSTLDFYASIGKGGIHKRREGDEKTPVGVYLVSSYLPGDTLPDLYGAGAFPITYPNVWDRLQGRTGSGIWIHGTESDRFSRPPLSSRGCVSLSNDNFELLRDHVTVARTPVVVSDNVEWVPRERLLGDRDAVIDAIEAWRSDWESRRTDRYLAHYAADFRTSDMDRKSFAAHKRRVNSGKRFIEVDLSELGIYRYPGERDMVVVEFRQHYRSDSYRGEKRKLQYWRRDDDGGWSIVYEG